MKINLRKQLKKSPFLLAPMDAVTDIGFREICEREGASYTCSELTSVESLIRDCVPKYRYEKSKLKINCVQLFGPNAENFVPGTEIVGDEADIIDVNFGCPSSTVTGNNAGSSLLKDPKNVGKIISNLTSSLNKPVTAKIRLGYTKQNFMEVAKEIEDAGADLITLHGRTAKQKYSGTADWSKIKELKPELRIPLVGNGDVSCEEDVDEYLGSHADGLMIGRAAIGRPLVFRRLQYYYEKGKKLEIEDYKSEQKKLFTQYLRRIANKGFNASHIKIQHQAMWFMKEIPGAKELRKKIVKEKNIDNIINLVKEF